jgi:hypothetical protein
VTGFANGRRPSARFVRSGASQGKLAGFRSHQAIEHGQLHPAAVAQHFNVARGGTDRSGHDSRTTGGTIVGRGARSDSAQARQ